MVFNVLTLQWIDNVLKVLDVKLPPPLSFLFLVLVLVLVLIQLLRESIAEHKPHIDKLMKIGPQLAELSAQEGQTVRQRFTSAEQRYQAIKDEVKGRAAALDEAVSQSTQVHPHTSTVRLHASVRLLLY